MCDIGSIMWLSDIMTNSNCNHETKCDRRLYEIKLQLRDKITTVKWIKITITKNLCTIAKYGHSVVLSYEIKSCNYEKLWETIVRHFWEFWETKLQLRYNVIFWELQEIMLQFWYIKSLTPYIFYFEVETGFHIMLSCL